MKKQILILDDDASVRESVCKVLADTGYEAVPAADGQAGLAQLSQHRFDLLLLDLDLPDLTGFDILDAVHDRVPWLPVIILTGVAEQCAAGSLLGAGALLHKPVDVLLLLETVETLLHQAAGKDWPASTPALSGQAALPGPFLKTAPRVHPRIGRGRLPKSAGA